MKKLIFLFAFALSLNFTHAQEAAGVNVQVTLENVLKEGGEILAALHTANTFMKANGIDNVTVEAKKGSLSFVFKDVKPGSYAVMVMHDVNSNKNMDFDSNGLPTESYGMSGNEMVMGPPTFEAAKFEVADKDLELNIRF
ncbi:DUF2141 domain-containing protein [Muriicola sp.]|uniref:DUF2141 domain-containing protein n=1 Tax=Muriicola sp. TaxID=2020856 RepID=UPI003C709BD6